ncbi:hypothetical protein HOC35_07265 [Candidatus Woesearchaeota archaeon]|jgi:hypothetical protein|nr:hypothetical protein [Candidatus Woesearchaeota archaeon]
MARITAERAKELLTKRDKLSNPVRNYLTHITNDDLAGYYCSQVTYFQSVMADESRSIDLLVYDSKSDSFHNSDDANPNFEYVNTLKYKIKRAQHDGVLKLDQEKNNTMLRSFISQILDIESENRYAGSETKADYSRDDLYSIHMGLKFLKKYFQQKMNSSPKQ